MVPVVSSGGVIDTHCEARAEGPGIVMGRYGSTDAVFFIDKDFWPHNTALFVTDFHGNNRRWCFYLLRIISKADYSFKSAVPGIDRKDLYGIYVPQPPINEQINLVRGVEQQLRAVETVMDRSQREIDLIREYRTRLIADVVTGKVDVRGLAAGLPEVEAAEPLDELSMEVEATMDEDPELAEEEAGADD